MSTKSPTPKKSISNILIAQANAAGNKSPYLELGRKHNVNVEFLPFVAIEGVPASEFRKQKIDITKYSAVILTSRNAIDHFFRIVTETKTSLSQEMKYFCTSEAVSLYLQKFILYRKRKIFYGADGSIKSFLEVLSKFSQKEQFIYPCSETCDSEITNLLTSKGAVFVTAVMYKVISSDIREALKKNFDIICLFTPGGARSLVENVPDFKQNGTVMACYGENTCRAASDLGFSSTIVAPAPEFKTMAEALDKYLKQLK